MASRSPTATTPLPKSSAAPESPSKDAPHMPQTVPFPPPQTFEIIPPLHGILLRLLSSKPSSSNTVGAPVDPSGASGAPTDDQGQGQPPSSIPGGGNNGTPATQAVPDLSTHDPNGNPALDVKDLPTETNSVKIRIQRARAVVDGLPDVHRSVEEQQKEIAELEDRVTRLRAVISDFGGRSRMTQTEHAKPTAAAL
ncbi:hypothetical protein N7462_002442 [Penicillium macrosclerotiorum]|uniref:uncharacterized protein n=1 Tax=Penicillium macrosclerotiorum TaxID=303699 RepID=UPI00254874CF|nr:uncharacterized protein N7462_002442 [Penicillium macrosclerotiorum]KAJ5693019.1 hypothetical protein N7462_002442 [Penicillium macrosclerotiorum]